MTHGKTHDNNIDCGKTYKLNTTVKPVEIDGFNKKYVS